MSISRLMSIPCTVVSEVPTGEKDRYGDPITETVEVETKCAFQQQRRTEHESTAISGSSSAAPVGEVSDTLWKLMLPYGTLISSGAAIRVKGREYELVAEPWSAEEGSRSMWHIEATVRRRAGTGES